mmetsp:Transcript_64147/g.134890  ORF Transcript_64147/g.134890 Transcript_64147/m.134890 type:complete len:457 (+) Transcript_64147:75-1445(+)
MSSEGELAKNLGNEMLKAGKLEAAIAAYTKAIEADATVAAYWSNRSQAYLRMQDAQNALKDGQEAARLNPSWAKAHYRCAQAYKDLKKPEESARACAAGLAVTTSETEKKELKGLQKIMTSAAAAVALSGWWSGVVSKELGGFDQEFCFLADGKLKCCVYGQELEGQYALTDVEVGEGNLLKGGLDVSLNETKVPYLFRVQGERDVLDLCCPMSSPDERPRTFHGPGHVAMKKGRNKTSAVEENLSEGQQIVRYTQELVEILQSRVPDEKPSNGDVAEKLLEDHEGGGTLTTNQLMGPESLEDKSKRLVHENSLQALRVKYGDVIAEAAEKLIKGDRKASEYPEEEKELSRLLQRFQSANKQKEEEEEKKRKAEEEEKKQQKKKKEEEEAQAKAKAIAEAEEKKVQQEKNEVQLHEKVGEPPDKKTQSDVLLAGKTDKKVERRGGCFEGCFSAFFR